MKVLKRILLFMIGIGAIITAIVLFSGSMRPTDLENGTLHDWVSASVERRTTAIKILTATDTDTEILVACVDKIATLPDSAQMAVRDATSLCYTGMQIRENL